MTAVPCKQVCGNPYNNDPQRGENSSKFAPLLVVETPSHRAAMERLLGMICIERIGMVRPAGCGATLLVNMRDIEPRKEDDGFDGAFLSP